MTLGPPPLSSSCGNMRPTKVINLCYNGPKTTVVYSGWLVFIRHTGPIVKNWKQSLTMWQNISKGTMRQYSIFHIWRFYICIFPRDIYVVWKNRNFVMAIHNDLPPTNHTHPWWNHCWLACMTDRSLYIYIYIYKCNIHDWLKYSRHECVYYKIWVLACKARTDICIYV